MARRRKTLRALPVMLAALALTAVVGVAPAAAEEVSATWSGSTIRATTSGVTVKKNGADAKSCTLLGGATAGSILSGAAYLANASAETRFECSGGTNLWVATLPIYPKYDTTTGKYLLKLSVSHTGLSPWGGGIVQTGAVFKGTWVNGSGSTPSTVTYEEATLGYQSSTGEPITLSGTFNVTTNSGGGLLTLSH